MKTYQRIATALAVVALLAVGCASKPRTNSTPPPIVQDETANWPVYINSQMGLEFKYPTGWFVTVQSPTRLMVSNKQGEFNKGNAPADYLYYYVDLQNTPEQLSEDIVIKNATEQKKFDIGNGQQITVYILTKKQGQPAEVSDIILPAVQAVASSNNKHYIIFNPSEPIAGGEQAQTNTAKFVELTAKTFKILK